MCGRFKLEISPKDIINFYRLIEELNNSYKENDYFLEKDFNPGSKSLIFTNNEIKSVKWGFPFNEKLVFNGRSEDIENKAMFKDLLYENKCIVPANSFYEWNNKVKYEVSLKEQYMFFAGLHRKYLVNNTLEDRFVILTVESNNKMKEIHERMPVILDQNDLSKYLFSNTLKDTLSLLNTSKKELIITLKDNKQLSFF